MKRHRKVSYNGEHKKGRLVAVLSGVVVYGRGYLSGLLADAGGFEAELKMTVGERGYTQFELVELPNASPRQIKIREGWLKR